MQNKYHDILKIFYRIKIAKPDDKLAAIERNKAEMNQLQQYIISKDKEMKKTTSKVNKAMRETVDIEGLSEKIFGKYLKFIQQKVSAPGPHISPVGQKKIRIPKEHVPEPFEKVDNQDLGTKQDLRLNATPLKSNAPLQQRQVAQQAEQGTD